MSADQVRRPYTDRCPECLDTLNLPKSSKVSGESVICTYRCLNCGHGWFCSWLAEAQVTEAEGHNGAA